MPESQIWLQYKLDLPVCAKQMMFFTSVCAKQMMFFTSVCTKQMMFFTYHVLINNFNISEFLVWN